MLEGPTAGTAHAEVISTRTRTAEMTIRVSVGGRCEYWRDLRLERAHAEVIHIRSGRPKRPSVSIVGRCKGSRNLRLERARYARLRHRICPGMFLARFWKVFAIRRTTFPISDVANSVSDVLT